ncbi:hypothetical protein DW993_17555 [Clostridium sp. AM51-4]|nr:hypothetical protein DW993_17555 [Clostridium sp. AM51-4]RHU34307.1 hypothetical protein DXD54_13940 [Clostridium sp. TM06-18]RHV53580.1 hypothetical protein DXB45_05765 [Clostridium sp. OM04-12AA]
MCPLRVFHAPAFAADFPAALPNFLNVRTAYASEIWEQLTKNLFTKSGTEKLRDNIYLFHIFLYYRHRKWNCKMQNRK